MIQRAPALLLGFCIAGLAAYAADPLPSGPASPTPAPSASPAAPTPSPTPGDVTVPLDGIAQMDMRDTTLANFVATNSHGGFRWVSNTYDAAESTDPGLVLFQIPVYDVVVRFANSKMHEVDISFYNRGDSGNFTREKFEGLVQNCAKALTAFTKVQPTDPGKDAAGAVKAQALVWQTEKARFLLESSFSRTGDTGFRAEFVRLTITEPEKPKSFMEESLASMGVSSDSSGPKFSGAAHVKTMGNGDVLIEGIPMVDQGDKGYCVVASAERVLRYYGNKVDENELAQIANTSLKEGTSPTAMLNALKKISDRLHVKTRTLLNLDNQQFDAMLDAYDQTARRGQRAPVLDRDVKDFTKLIKQVKPDLLLEARTKNPSDMDQFFRTVQARVNEGVPPLWSVMMGLFPKAKEDDEYGGHMRLIIGYNPKTNEILFSDSWGYGFELERMPVNAAWTITDGVYSIEPLE